MSETKIGKQQLLDQLKEWGIDNETVDHDEVFTVEQALPHVSHLDGMFMKNLFLRDKKKKLYLFCAPHDAEIKLNDLAKLVNAPGGFRFADEGILYEKLGLRQGCVSVFGIINDINNDVKLIVDQRLLDGSYKTMYFHPVVNSASTGISSEGLRTFIEKTNHEPVIVNIPKYNNEQSECK